MKIKKIPVPVCLLLLSFLNCTCQNAAKIDTLEFQPGYPALQSTALEQLEAFPAPRYKPNNDLVRLFNWMDPAYLGGSGQDNMTVPEVVQGSVLMQEELALHWNYFLCIPNSTSGAFPQYCKNKSTLLGADIDLANRHPEIPLGMITFWTQLRPAYFGYPGNRPHIMQTDLPDQLYIRNAKGEVVKKVLSFAAPDSLFIADGQLQRKCIQNILDVLTRPIDLINENGEEPPGVTAQSIAMHDPAIIADKEKLGISDWHIYFSEKQAHMRKLYASQFMELPALKNAKFTIYTVEGGPVDRFDWQTSRSSCSLIRGNYYSTPDFYPRTPDNWKLWKGPWHGWKWINDGRMVEIKSGDRFFSPFVAAGWAYNPEQDIRPGQWLGLLKSLSVIGAEFYYVGYFNLSKPFSKPENYIWQAAMPAYAQAVTSRFGDIFRNGNVLMDESGQPVITYPVNGNDRDVLVAVRKHNEKEQYIISATVQPFSNTEAAPLKKNVTITIGDESYTIEARRQGSVYFLDRSVRPCVFYQLDRWHQYEHPMRWRKELILEAELADTSSSPLVISSTCTVNGPSSDFSKSEAACQLSKDQWLGYTIAKRDLAKLDGNLFIHLYVKGRKGDQVCFSAGEKQEKAALSQTGKWQWITLKADRSAFITAEAIPVRITALSAMAIDRICISNSPEIPDLSSY